MGLYHTFGVSVMGKFGFDFRVVEFVPFVCRSV
ncbi:hypothetical protein ISN44_As05g047990 [Arabidopsis suecica]|uniref:Uncharacterized protein n=1 Tax=Arabidopsis suecica TaxID=45249 RepID=A0A8T2DL24_ARASU|nr:hypothetical protein ISN44_As05g047990 [Arabidopsis suecica]